MKIAISATGRDLESNIATRFGKCPFFLVVDIKTKEVKAIVNEVRDHPSGIGVTVGNVVEDEGIDAIITIDIGPKTFEIFHRGGIKMYQTGGKVKDAIRQFEEGKLVEITEPTVPKEPIPSEY
jgi:predicted Fe-Mo cluster-binding NifX family protein